MRVPSAAFSGGKERNAARASEKIGERIKNRRNGEEGATWLVDAGEIGRGRSRSRSRRRKQKKQKQKKKEKEKKNHVDARKHRELLSLQRHSPSPSLSL
jgi:hypothetical protein